MRRSRDFNVCFSFGDLCLEEPELSLFLFPRPCPALLLDLLSLLLSTTAAAALVLLRRTSRLDLLIYELELPLCLSRPPRHLPALPTTRRSFIFRLRPVFIALAASASRSDQSLPIFLV